MYLNHIQEKFLISFGGIPFEFGSMDKKNLGFTTNMKSRAICTKSPKTMNYTINMILPPTKMIQMGK